MPMSSLNSLIALGQTTSSVNDSEHSDLGAAQPRSGLCAVHCSNQLFMILVRIRGEIFKGVSVPVRSC